MGSDRTVRRVALTMGAAAVGLMGVLGGTQVSMAAPGDPAPTPAPAGPSAAPANPVNCADPNNQINCQAPPIDSPLVPGGTAAPGSPFRD